MPLHDTRASFFPKNRPDPQSLPLAWEWIEGRPTVTGVAAGITDIRPGDVIESLDGLPILEVLGEEESRVSGATPEARRWRALERLLYGPAGSKVRLGLARGGEIPLSRDISYLFPDHRGIEWLTTFWTVAPKTPRLPRAAFLVDARTDGYSETQLGIVERYRLGEIVGARSGGNNGSFNWTDLPGGYRLIWTGQRVLKHDGSPWHGVGVAPTLPAERTLAGVAAGRDEVVEAAVAALRRK